MTKSVYLVGPTQGTGYWLTFEKAEDELKAAGYNPLTAVSFSVSQLDKEKRMKIKMALIDVADAILFLPGWQNDYEAELERRYAEFIGKPCVGGIASVKAVLG